MELESVIRDERLQKAGPIGMNSSKEIIRAQTSIRPLGDAPCLLYCSSIVILSSARLESSSLPWIHESLLLVLAFLSS